MHLEQAVEQVNDAVLANTSTPDKEPNYEWLEFCTKVQKLGIYTRDSDCAWTGLAISLSKPLQRLFKYSILFQTLLSHTDPELLEYEGALRLVAEVENIIRSLEDAKNQNEERDKTRDIIARIKGLEKVIQFAVPKPARILVEEIMLNPKEFGDVLGSGVGGIGSRKDVWLVVFTDIVLRCQRTGIISLPLGAAHSSTSDSLSELQGNSNYATTGPRNSSARRRNLYKFMKASISSYWRTQSNGVVVRLRIGLLATSINSVKEWFQWMSMLCQGVIRNSLLI